ncbi:hypothetical protein [Sphingobacterium zeae]|uniref:MFS transporter n=1 Tax=Sphingobacterium zeae TaxID=1776859 RepID=A0ABU0UAM9_9SPHI|nr:hypothetical protein [Sphingobacterium zeae]MDQ1151921.1 hypothetical protein [Sphingobacterium zeae]
MNDLFALFYEKFYYETDFSLEMFDRFLYQKYAIIAIISAAVFSLVFYFLLDRPRFAKIGLWFILLTVASFVSAGYLYNDSKSIMERDNLVFSSEAYFGVAIGSFVLTLFVFFILSLFFRKLSKNLSRTPF